MRHHQERNVRGDGRFTLPDFTRTFRLQQTQRKLLAAAIKRNWNTVESTLFNDRDAVECVQLLATEITAGELTAPLFHHLCHRHIPLELFEKCLASPFSLDLDRPMADRSGITTRHINILEMCIQEDLPDHFKLFIEHGAQTNIRTSNGQSLIERAIFDFQGKHPVNEFAKFLYEKGSRLDFLRGLTNSQRSASFRGMKLNEDVSGWDFENADLINTDLSSCTGIEYVHFRGAWYSPQTVFPEGTCPVLLGMNRALQGTESNPWICDRGIEVPRNIDDELSGLANEACIVLGETFERRRRWTQVATAMYSDDIHSADPLPLVRSLVELRTLPVRFMDPSIQEVESKLDDIGETRRTPFYWHPNEADFLAMCNDPRAWQDSGHLSTLSRVLTAQTQWIRYDGARANDVTDIEMLTWALIGRITYGFRRWRFDAVTLPIPGDPFPLPSLLEHYGFDRVESSSSSTVKKIDGKKNILGMGREFVLGTHRIKELVDQNPHESTVGTFKFNPDGHYALYRGCAIASIPGQGTLLIRNSSPEFGRTLLKKSAYYTTLDVSNPSFREFISDLDQKRIESHFHSIFDLSYNQKGSQFPEKFRLLAWHLDQVAQDYATWRFDTNPATLFQKERILGIFEDEKMVGGYKSKGFIHFLDFLEAALESPTEPRLGLSFVPKHDLPFEGYPFFTPHKTQSGVLPVTAQRLDILRRLNEDEFVSDEELTASSIRQFIQEAGFDSHGELIIVPLWRNEVW